MSSSNRPSSKTRKRGSGSLFVLSRFALVLMIAGIIAVGSAYKLIDTTIIHGAEWVAKGDSTLNVTAPVPPLRGEILASDGSILATNLNYYDVRVDFRASRFRTAKYAHPDTLAALACSLHRYFPKRDTSEWRKYLARPLKTPRNKRSRAFLVAKAVPKSIADKIRHFPFFRISRNANYTGLSITPVLKRAYPYGDMAQLSIGRVGEVESGEIRGVSGLERALDTMLYGVPGVKRKRLFTSGEGYWQETAPQTGMGVRTTIDIRMQDILEYELGEMLLKAKAEWGTAILMEVKTGEIKAISNIELLEDGTYGEALNRAVLPFEPGSVMKPISLMIAFEDGLVKHVTDQVSCAPFQRTSDPHGSGMKTMKQVIEQSSNPGIARVIFRGYEKDPARFHDRLAELGFFEPIRSGIAGECTPRIRKLLPKDSKGNNITIKARHLDLARQAYGYNTELPPLFTLAVYNAIANGGRYVRPHLMKGLVDEDGNDSIIPIQYIRDRICSEETARKVRECIAEVVWGEHGTARAVRDDRVKVAGKTGTAYPVENGVYNKAKRRYAFAGFFPYENPQYSCIALVLGPSGTSANRTSGQVVKNMAVKMYSRGRLNNSSTYTAEAKGHKPIVVGSEKCDNDMLASSIGAKGMKHYKTAKVHPEGAVPDVKGFDAPTAVKILEERGINVRLSGAGYVVAQSIPAGTGIRPNQTITLHLRI